MRKMLLGLAAPLAAILVPAAPAAVLDPAHSQFTAGSAAGVTIHRGVSGRFDRDGDFRGGRDRRDRHDRRRHRGFDGGLFVYDRDWDGGSAWRANSYNDWWHERPHRSFPRWVRNNQGCERQWWSGAGWRC